jgi:hypothetical protein
MNKMSKMSKLKNNYQIILENMILNRHHILEIIKYIYDNYKNITTNPNEKFEQAMLNPELFKPKRYTNNNNIPTLLFILRKQIEIKSNDIFKFYYNNLYEKQNNNTSISINDIRNKKLNIHNNIVKFYRTNSYSIHIQGIFILDNILYENKKIIKTQDDFNYNRINKCNGQCEYIEIKAISDCVIYLIQHIEYIPHNNEGNALINKQIIKINDNIIKYKMFYITSYDNDKFTQQFYDKYYES